jgi:hypothetical protein
MVKSTCVHLQHQILKKPTLKVCVRFKFLEKEYIVHLVYQAIQVLQSVDQGQSNLWLIGERLRNQAH